MSLRERLGLEHPVVGAGLGGGLSRARLTVAIGEAGGLGQLGIMPPAMLRAELRAHRERSARPVAVNMLLPFARRAHWEAAREADAVVTFWGAPRRRTDRVWVHQCGSVPEVKAAAEAGADGVIVQGAEAGGHVRGTMPALELLERARAALPAGYPVWLAGGVAERADAQAAIAAGAEAVVCGTRFLLSEESDAHEDYKRRLLGARETVVTELFGAGWPAPHRVVRNAATERWLRGSDRAPAWVGALHHATAPVLSRLPVALVQRAAATQRPSSPLLSPAAATTGDPASLVDAGPLYAGECVARIESLRPAGELVRELAGAPA
ncbi:MAG TPA: nitronate monooxygenase [Solirubrobacteraceae bacterium]|nr:nitronate monooxygenase [Solirubrobacteraceae bacterium]